MDQKVCEAKKRLNAACAQSRKQEQKLSELETQHNQMRKDASDAEAMDAGTSDAAMVSNKCPPRNIEIFPFLIGTLLTLVCVSNGDVSWKQGLRQDFKTACPTQR